MNLSWHHPREQLVTTMARIYRHHMTTTSGGNLSIRDPEGGMWITPSRVDKGALTPRDMVRVFADETSAGLHPPSSEYPFHREIYRRRPDIKAIVHAHPGALVAFSICRILPDTRVQSHAHAVCGKLAFAPYACPGTQELGDNIAAAFATGADCVLLENHGVVIGGVDLQDAFQRFETLEFVAQTLVRAHQLGEVRVLSPEALDTHTVPEYRDAEFPSLNNHEKALRSDLCRFLHRAYEQRLLISTAGAFSARLGAKEFLITPRRRDRLEVEPAALVRMGDGTKSANQSPSRAARLHERIYALHPDIGVIINAQPLHASAFCMTPAAFNSHTIPESALVLRNVPKLPFLRLVEDADEIARQISLNKVPVVLIANEGAVVVGRTFLEAFDRLEVLEATAEAIILAQPLGPLVPMPASAIAELHRVFDPA